MEVKSKKRAYMYTFLVLIFPFLVLFSPRLSFGFTHARLDELLVLSWFPLAFSHYYSSVVGYIRRCNSAYFRAFLVLFAVFVFGLFYGEGEARWTQSNLKLVTRPFVLILNLFVIRYWIYRSNVRLDHIVASLVAALSLAGGIGYLAMSNPVLALILRGVYSSGLDMYDDNYSFDMSRRAMAVFSGYDQAGIAYALGVLLALFLFLNSRTSRGRFFSILAMFCLFISILTTARIGFVGIMFGASTFLGLNLIGKARRILFALALLVAFMTMTIPVGQYFIENEETLKRYEDVKKLFDFTSNIPFWQRSSGVEQVLSSQIQGINYPQGLDLLLGLGDKGEFISDVGYVTVLVKYGVLGVGVLLYSMAVIGMGGFRAGKINATGVAGVPISALLPGIMVLFAVASCKGGLYFISYTIGELFALILALCVVETEMVLGCKNPLRRTIKAPHL